MKRSTFDHVSKDSLLDIHLKKARGDVSRSSQPTKQEASGTRVFQTGGFWHADPFLGATVGKVVVWVARCEGSAGWVRRVVPAILQLLVWRFLL